MSSLYDQFNASLMNKSIIYLKKNLTDLKKKKIVILMVKECKNANTNTVKNCYLVNRTFSYYTR